MRTRRCELRLSPRPQGARAATAWGGEFEGASVRHMRTIDTYTTRGTTALSQLKLGPGDMP